jgi:hypothetical protein
MFPQKKNDTEVTSIWKDFASHQNGRFTGEAKSPNEILITEPSVSTQIFKKPSYALRGKNIKSADARCAPKHLTKFPSKSRLLQCDILFF